MSETTILWLCILVAVLGIAAMGGMVYFGQALSRRIKPPGEEVWRAARELLYEPTSPFPLEAALAALYRTYGDAYAEFLQRRNEFWTTYAQVLIAAVIIVVLTILLLANAISPEAGLPILSGVAGFAIAKGVPIGRAAPPPPPPPPERPLDSALEGDVTAPSEVSVDRFLARMSRIQQQDPQAYRMLRQKLLEGLKSEMGEE
jgi:hypothetical protein